MVSGIWADVVFSTESLAVVAALVVALASAVGVLFRMYVAGVTERLAEMTAQRDNYREMAKEAVTNLEIAVNRRRQDHGQAPFKVVDPVEPEHNSPVTEKQQDTADLQTLRARLVAANLALLLPPREALPPEVSQQ